MTEPQSDDEFETFLKRRTVLPNGMSDDDKLEPPKALDALVLKRAREAVRERRQSNRAPRWATPVALAATILLCLSVVLNVSLNTNRPTADLRRQTAATTADKAPAAAPSAASGLSEEVVTGTASREAILPEAKIAEPRAPRPPVLAETRAPAEARTPATADSPRVKRSAAEKAAAFADRSGTSAVAPSEPSLVLDSVAVTGARRGGRDRAPAQGAGQAAAAPGSIAEAGRLAKRADDRSRTPPAAPSETPPLASAAPSAPAAPATDGAAGLQEHEPALAKRQAGQAAGAVATAAAPHPRDPKTWLRQIDALRAEGKTAQADAEMQRFRAIFPAYPAKPSLSAPSEPPK
jgi:hypothetical protein